MTRTGLSPRLGAHSPEPSVEVHPADAIAAGLADGSFAKISTPYGSTILKVAVDSGQRRGSLFVPIHWSDATASSARISEMVTSATDPFSGQPEAKATPARIAPTHFAYRGFALTRRPVTLPPGTWFSRVSVAGGTGLLFATNETPAAWRNLARAMMPADVEFAEYVDPLRGLFRVAAFRPGRFDGCIFVGPADTAPQWEAVRVLFEADALTERDRRTLLSGYSADGITETGPLICACFGVGLAAIRTAVASGQAVSVDHIGRTLRAGTNCGSCIPELKRIIAGERYAEAACHPAAE
jgi:assimilatory nitrate reductase catalytic subunit